MGALTPGRSALRVLVRDIELRSVSLRSLCFMYRIFPSFRLQPPPVASRIQPVLFRELTARSANRIPYSGPERHLGFAFPLQARHDNRPNRVRHPTDRSFTSSCSPPPLVRTQLLSVTEFRPNPTRTHTLLIQYTYKRTTAGPSARIIFRYYDYVEQGRLQKSAE